MKAYELVEILSKYPPDAPVVALWDGAWANLNEHSLEKDDNGLTVIEFDVSDHGTYGTM